MNHCAGICTAGVGDFILIMMQFVAVNNEILVCRVEAFAVATQVVVSVLMLPQLAHYFLESWLQMTSKGAAMAGTGTDLEFGYLCAVDRLWGYFLWSKPMILCDNKTITMDPQQSHRLLH